MEKGDYVMKAGGKGGEGDYERGRKRAVGREHYTAKGEEEEELAKGDYVAKN